MRKPMEAEEAIEIQPVANGFFVSPAGRAFERSGGQVSPAVFQTMQGLIDFLQAHFSHRCQHVAADQGGAS